ncbi:HNH endonuclease signature motif containing protein [Ruicaihuangia caeni]|uniref:HNH endonuclease signature motif containing protein n=1 Tax=Ruicaihuangia caeni TaxID=3042517 RepID=UPI00338F8822
MVHRWGEGDAAAGAAAAAGAVDAALLPAGLVAFVEAQHARIESADDAGLIELLEVAERAGRLLDSLRVSVAGEIGRRSRTSLGEESMARRHGCRTAVELVQRVTGVSAVTAQRRLRLGERLTPETTLTGETVPPAFPTVAAALREGRIGVDTATAIVTTFGPLLDRVTPVEDRDLVPAGGVLEVDFVAAEAAVTGSAGEFHADEVRVQAQVWRAAIDPDGAVLSDEQAMARRFLRLGRARDGLIPITGMLMPEVAASLQRQLDAHLSPRRQVAFEDSDSVSGADADSASSPSGQREAWAASDPAAASGANRAGAAAAGLGAGVTVASDLGGTPVYGGSNDLVKPDPRSFDQRRHDVLASILDTAARAADAPTIGGAPPTVIVAVQQRDLDRGSGAAMVDGVSEPVSMVKARAYACNGGIQQAIMNAHGGIISLSSPQRVFTPQQRRAITLRDSGCVIPGCSITAAWCELHHATPASHGGPTSVENGVSLCYFHHRTIDTSGWRISMRHGTPWVKPPPWLDPTGTWRPSTKSRIRIAMRT